MFNLKKMILENRKGSNAIAGNTITKEDTQDFTNWKNTVETLRLKVSDYATASRTNSITPEQENAVFEAYKGVLTFFTNKALGEKLNVQRSDLNSMLTFIGCKKKADKEAEMKEFLPVGTGKFRKEIEDFISDRLTSQTVKTAEEIEAARKAKREAKKARVKAEKELVKKAETKAA